VVKLRRGVDQNINWRAKVRGSARHTGPMK